MKRKLMKTILIFVLSIGLLGANVYGVEQPSPWAEAGINKLKVEGEIAPSFFTRYQEEISRKDFAYLIYKLYKNMTGLELSNSAYEKPWIKFSDSSDYYVLEVAKSGIISGYGDGTYRPEDKITREQMAVLYLRLLQKAGVSIERNTSGIRFSDERSISIWAIESIKICNKMGIIYGIGNNNIDPQGSSTREASLIVYLRIAEAFGGDSGDFEFVSID